MNTLQNERFEDALGEHVEMCFKVALALTRNPGDARKLTHDVIAAAWHAGHAATVTDGIKMTLLSAVRGEFILNYAQKSHDRASLQIPFFAPAFAYICSDESIRHSAADLPATLTPWAWLKPTYAGTSSNR